MALWQEPDRKRQIVGEYETGEYACYMLKDNQYKYIYSVPDEKEYLFVSDIDPQELVNRADNPLYKKITSSMRKQLIGYLEKNGISVDDGAGNWIRYGKKEMAAAQDAYLLFQDPVATIPHIPGYTTTSNEKAAYEFAWLSSKFKG